MAKEIKWSQWGSEGMIRCGRNDLKTIMNWMKDLGKEAAECVKNQNKNHAVYGRKIYDDADQVSEVRFYCNTYMTDDELNEAIDYCPHDVFYVAHKR